LISKVKILIIIFLAWKQ